MKLTVVLCTLLPAAMAANVAGKWDVTAQASNGREYKLVMELVEKEGKWSGSMSNERGSMPLEEIQVEGDDLRYSFTAGASLIKVKLKREAETLKGDFDSPEGITGTLTASRAVEKEKPSLLGLWNVTAKMSDGMQHTVKLKLEEKDGVLTGALVVPDGPVLPLTSLTKEGDGVSFKVGTEEGSFTVKLAMAGAGMKGTYTRGDGRSGEVEAVR
ncbi:MAG: hypothetical protein FJW20_09740 [Acidimicrobiia bacterium]|nr:hypothetical protein [Acidimicrobiia bacterium]